MLAVLLEGLVVSCRRMLGVEDRASIMTGVDAGLSQVCIARSIGRSPSVVCREIARHTGPDGQYRAEEADKAARAARRRPKKASRVDNMRSGHRCASKSFRVRSRELSRRITR